MREMSPVVTECWSRLEMMILLSVKVRDAMNTVIEDIF